MSLSLILMSGTSLKQFVRTSTDWRLAIDRNHFVFESGNRAGLIHNGIGSIVGSRGVSTC